MKTTERTVSEHMLNSLRQRITGALRAITAIAIVAMFASPLVADEQTPATPALADVPGLHYELHVLDEPRPVRVHVLTVDLVNEAIEPRVIIGENPAPADRNATRVDPLRLADHPRTLAFINANPWTPWGPEYPHEVSIVGLAASDGEVRSEPGTVSMWTDGRDRAFIGHPQDAAVQEGVGGFIQLIDDGERLVEPSDALHPRTAIAVNEAGDRLCLIVVDGRDKGVSEGMSYYELALFIDEHLDESFNAWDAAALDGGGSSIMGARNEAGALRVLNEPSDDERRALPVVLTVRRRAEVEE